MNWLEKVSGELFHFLGYSFDIDVAKQIAQSKVPIILNRSDIENLGGFTGLLNVDQDFAMATESAEPIILAFVYTSPKQGGYFLIDGHHRIYRALNAESQNIEAYLLDFEETLQTIPNDLIRERQRRFQEGSEESELDSENLEL